MDVDPLPVPGSYVVTPRTFGDDRGQFREWLRQDAMTRVLGHPVELAQANWSVSRRGVVRGVHYADVPPGQAKYVTCAHGAVLDVVVDLRTGSPTFGAHAAVELDARAPRAVYLSEGLGHAFAALTDDATVLYLCSTPYDPAAEHGIHPLDPALAIRWPDGVDPLLSPKDGSAPTLAEAQAAGALPTWAACQAWNTRSPQVGAGFPA